ncbi:MAG: hypothetical protein DRP09_13990 [Candidatus Thorarchaeota archaeon]|nr:MAG: hypothetical protein DRP09_13990 [Candidatus Thorarchaeota archaeon]
MRRGPRPPEVQRNLFGNRSCILGVVCCREHGEDTGAEVRQNEGWAHYSCRCTSDDVDSASQLDPEADVRGTEKPQTSIESLPDPMLPRFLFHSADLLPCQPLDKERFY